MTYRPEWVDLDVAWSKAVIFPNGWRLRSIEKEGMEVEYTNGRKEYVEWWRATARGPNDEEISEAGGWPVDALKMLVDSVIEGINDRTIDRIPNKSD